MVARVGHEQSPRTEHEQGLRPVELGLGRSITGHPVVAERAHERAIAPKHLDPVVAAVLAHVHQTILAERDVGREDELPGPLAEAAEDPEHLPTVVHHGDPMLVRVSDPDLALGRDTHSSRESLIELGHHPLAAVRTIGAQDLHARAAIDDDEFTSGRPRHGARIVELQRPLAATTEDAGIRTPCRERRGLRLAFTGHHERQHGKARERHATAAPHQPCQGDGSDCSDEHQDGHEASDHVRPLVVHRIEQCAGDPLAARWLHPRRHDHLTGGTDRTDRSCSGTRHTHAGPERQHDRPCTAIDPCAGSHIAGRTPHRKPAQHRTDPSPPGELRCGNDAKATVHP